MNLGRKKEKEYVPTVDVGRPLTVDEALMPGGKHYQELQSPAINKLKVNTMVPDGKNRSLKK